MNKIPAPNARKRLAKATMFRSRTHKRSKGFSLRHDMHGIRSALIPPRGRDVGLTSGFYKSSFLANLSHA